jgi:hypothetical protein
MIIIRIIISPVKQRGGILKFMVISLTAQKLPIVIEEISTAGWI